MKKLIIVACAIAAVLMHAHGSELVTCAEKHVALSEYGEYANACVNVFTNASPLMNEAYDMFFKPTATTNLVIAYEIVESRMEPCACPDGYVGCLAQHYRRVTDTRYERAVAAMPETYVLQSADTEVMLKWMARRDSNDVAAVSLPCDAEHPVGFIDLRAIREMTRDAKAQKACAYEILPSRP